MIKLKQQVRLFFALLSITFFLSNNLLSANEFSFRKYQHVKQFYKDIYEDSIRVGLKYNIPPAAIMAIAGLESGYGSGYVSQITGNILSLGAFKDDAELPSLYLPYSKSKRRVIFISKKIKELDGNDLAYKQRPRSLKRDYRPIKYAGTTKNLELLYYNNELRNKARHRCLNDFATRWIVPTSKIKVFSDSSVWLRAKVKKESKITLLKKDTCEKFIDKIGGVPHSFNYRKSWPTKVKLIMHKAGLIELVHEIHTNKKTFNKAWSYK